MTDWQDDESARVYLRRKHSPPSSYEMAANRMDRGPFIANNGHALIVPSEWYKPEAAQLWASLGFTWDKDTKSWTRDTRQPLRGKTYTPAAWLKAARRKYAALWPQVTECLTWQREEQKYHE